MLPFLFFSSLFCGQILTYYARAMGIVVKLVINFLEEFV